MTKIEDILPKKKQFRFVTEKRILRKGSNTIEITDSNITYNKEAEIYNQAINDCLAALKKADVAVVPSEEELIDILDNFDQNIHGNDEVAKAIRQHMLSGKG